MGESGHYARVVLNVKGRKPHGMVDPHDYNEFRDELIARLEATADDRECVLSGGDAELVRERVSGLGDI